MATALGAQVIASIGSSQGQGASASSILASRGLDVTHDSIKAVDLSGVSAAMPKASSGVHVLVSDSIFADAGTSLANAVDVLLDACQAASSLKSVLFVSRASSNGSGDLAQGMLGAAIDHATTSLSKVYDASVIHVVSGRKFGQADEQALLGLMSQDTNTRSWDSGTRFILPSAHADGVVQTTPKQHAQRQPDQEPEAAAVKQSEATQDTRSAPEEPAKHYQHQREEREREASGEDQPSPAHRSILLALLLRVFGAAFPMLMTHRLLANMLVEEHENELQRRAHAEALESRTGGSGRDHKALSSQRSINDAAAAKSRSRASSEDCSHESDVERDLWFSYWIIFGAVCLIDDYFVPRFLQSAVFVPLMVLLAWCGAAPGATGALTAYAVLVDPAREFVSQIDSVVASQIVENAEDSDEDTDGEYDNHTAPAAAARPPPAAPAPVTAVAPVFSMAPDKSASRMPYVDRSGEVSPTNDLPTGGNVGLGFDGFTDEHMPAASSQPMSFDRSYTDKPAGF
jgi:hypothetical protein